MPTQLEAAQRVVAKVVLDLQHEPTFVGKLVMEIEVQTGTNNVAFTLPVNATIIQP